MLNHTEVGKLIYQYTHNKNMTIAELAKEMDISYQHLNHIITGARNINKKHIQKICNILKLNREERAKIREAAFISNPTISITTKDKKLYILKFIYLIVQRAPNISQEQYEQCKKILSTNIPTNTQSQTSQSIIESQNQTNNQNKENNNKHFKQ